MAYFFRVELLVGVYPSWECWCAHTMTQSVFSKSWSCARLLERSLELCAVSWFQWAFEKKGNVTVSRANCLFPIAMMVVLLGSNKHVIWEAIWWYNWVYFQFLIWHWLSSNICFRKKWYNSADSAPIYPQKQASFFSSSRWPFAKTHAPLQSRSRWPYTWASSLRLWSGLLWCSSVVGSEGNWYTSEV